MCQKSIVGLNRRHFGKFISVHCKNNNEVRLSHILVKDGTQKPMIVMHGLLGYRANFQTICRKTPISTYRKSYCVAMRNHAMADHHDEHNYNVMADDVIRFADEQGLDKFTVMGHSMGGRTAMTIACRYPERVDGVISLDAAPVDESFEIEQFGSFAQAVLDFLFELKEEN